MSYKAHVTALLARKNEVLAAAPGKDSRPVHPIKAILAGGVAGGIEICLTYPTEYVKTQIQLDSRTRTPKYTGLVDCAKYTVRNHGAIGLYRGIAVLIYGSIPKASVRFGMYEQARNYITGGATRKLTQLESVKCGLTAGVVEAILVVCPMETIKVRFVNDQTLEKPKFKGFLHGTRQIIGEAGVLGLWQGLVPTILKQGSNQAMRFFVYNTLKQRLQGDTDRQLEFYETAAIGATAGGVSVLGNTPIDTVKTRMQGLDSHRYRSTWHTITTIYKDEGVLAFYKGTVPRLSRVCADVAIVFVLYEKVKQALDYLEDRMVSAP